MGALDTIWIIVDLIPDVVVDVHKGRDWQRDALEWKTGERNDSNGSDGSISHARDVTAVV